MHRSIRGILGYTKWRLGVTALGRRTTFWPWSMRFSLFYKENRKVYRWRRSPFMLITIAKMFLAGIYFLRALINSNRTQLIVTCFCLRLPCIVCLLRFSWTDIGFRVATCFTIYQWLSIPSSLVASRFVFATTPRTAHKIRAWRTFKEQTFGES